MGKEWDNFKPDYIKKKRIEQDKRIKIKPRTDGRKVPRDQGSTAAGSYDFSLKGNKKFQEWFTIFSKECLRVLKPGGHLLSFGGTRTYHRMVCAIEDAGFEIRDTLQWIYGSGFPKNLDIGKQIDKQKGAERKIVGQKKLNPRDKKVYTPNKYNGLQGTSTFEKNPNMNMITAPSTSEAKQWDGYGTALKPANEPIVLARKPISEKNIAENVLKWGTGGLNIDGCRIEYQSEKDYNSTKFGKQTDFRGNKFNTNRPSNGHILNENVEGNIKGRFPANVIFDEEAADLLNEQSGERKAGGKVKGHEPSRTGDRGIYSKWGRVENNPFNDKGGASRFFYVAKASKSERNAGLEGFEKKQRDESRKEGNPGGDNPRNRGLKKISNFHPTVKPIKLIRYLVRLVTPPNGICVDPFAGSGTTPIACIEEGFNYIAIEKEKEYFDISEKRIFYYKRNLKLF